MVTTSTPPAELAHYYTCQSNWDQGAKAAREGLSRDACPFPPLNYQYVSWHNGWTAATHHKAKEEDDF